MMVVKDCSKQGPSRGVGHEGWGRRHLDGCRGFLVGAPEQAPLASLDNQLAQLEILNRWPWLTHLGQGLLHLPVHASQLTNAKAVLLGNAFPCRAMQSDQ